MDSTSSPATPDARRPVIAVGLLAIGLIHTLDLPSKIHETPYLAAGYVVVILASLVVAIGATAGTRPRQAFMAIAVATGPIVGYILSRSVGLPGATGDIGNWLEPLGLASIFVEAAVLVLVAQAWTSNLRSPGSATGSHPRSAVLAGR